jgi:membrane-bound serine protease (ClpP class)
MGTVRRGRFVRAVLVAAIVGAYPAMASSTASAQNDTVLLTRIRATITPVIADHIGEGVERAAREGHGAYLVELDTPGGLDTSMRDIIQDFLSSAVPVVVYVAPQGARAASAGTFITMSAHVAAMAPGTAIGAATPVALQDGEISDKVVNDAAAYAESIARLRNRDAEFAVDAVREGRSVTADEAVEIGVVDLLAPHRRALLEAIDGTTVRLASGAEVTLRTDGAQIVAHDLGRFRQVLQWLADPNLAFLFISIGTLAIIYELANPGIGAGGIIGVILLILALFALSVLPVNALGAILLVLGAGLLAAEVLTPGVGVFAGGGTISLLLGGVFLFRGPVGVSPTVLLPVAIVVGGGTVLAGRVAWRSRKAPSVSGPGALIGRRGIVRAASGPSGQVIVDGAWWNARTAGPPLEVGAKVRVVDLDGLELIVEPDGRTEEVSK